MISLWITNLISIPLSTEICNFKYNFVFLAVLALAGMELISFVAPCIAMCFGFVSKMVLIAHKSSSVLLLSSTYTVSRFSFSHWKQVHWGYVIREEAQAGQLNQTDQRDIQYYITSCSTINLRDKFWLGNPSLEIGWTEICLWEVVMCCLCITYFVSFSFIFHFFILFFSSLNYP